MFKLKHISKSKSLPRNTWQLALPRKKIVYCALNSSLQDLALIEFMTQLITQTDLNSVAPGSTPLCRFIISTLSLLTGRDNLFKQALENRIRKHKYPYLGALFTSMLPGAKNAGDFCRSYRQSQGGNFQNVFCTTIKQNKPIGRKCDQISI